MPVLYVGARKEEGFHRQRYGEVLAEVYGFDVLDAADRRVLKTHFDADGRP